MKAIKEENNKKPTNRQTVIMTNIEKTHEQRQLNQSKHP